jgi:hypothetical protein
MYIERDGRGERGKMIVIVTLSEGTMGRWRGNRMVQRVILKYIASLCEESIQKCTKNW